MNNAPDSAAGDGVGGKEPCPRCFGRGWYVWPDSYGDPEQVQCRHCGATDEDEIPKPWGYELWRHLHDEHGLTLLEGELQEIVMLANALAGMEPSAVADVLPTLKKLIPALKYISTWDEDADVPWDDPGAAGAWALGIVRELEAKLEGRAG
jgi:hypothetical protein